MLEQLILVRRCTIACLLNLLHSIGRLLAPRHHPHRWVGMVGRLPLQSTSHPLHTELQPGFLLESPSRRTVPLPLLQQGQCTMSGDNIDMVRLAGFIPFPFLSRFMPGLSK
jgi:hypothetical protein